MNQSRGFRLHPVNVIFILLAFGAGVLNLLTTEASADRTSAYQVGQALGYGAALCILAGVVSLFIWLLSQRNWLAANVTFAGLILLGTFVTVANVLIFSQVNQDMEDYAEVLRDNMDKSTEEARRASDQMLSEMIENSSGDQQQSYIATQQYMNMLLDGRTEWEAAYEVFMDDRVLDYSLLTTEEEFEYQKSAIKQFAESSAAFAVLYETSPTLMRAALEDTEMQSQQIAEFMAGFTDSSRDTNAITARFLRAHEAAANEYHTLLELLEAEVWELDADTGDLLFETDEGVAAFETITNTAAEWEIQIEQLNAEIERRQQAAAQASQR